MKKRLSSGLQVELTAGGASLSFAVIDETRVDGYVASWAEGLGLADLQVDVDGERSELTDLERRDSVGSAVRQGEVVQWTSPS